MKKSILFSSLLATTMLISFGCTKSQDHKAELNKTLAEINQKNQDTLKEIEELQIDISKIGTQGGQPGSITLNGDISRAADKTDSRLSVSQSAGLARTGSATALAADKEILKTNALSAEKIEELKALFKKSQESEKTFINLGCQLDESDIAGLTESTQKIGAEDQIISLSATRIFMCGQVTYKRQLYTISANEILLKDLDIKYIKNLGSLKINAGTLVLVGQNKIGTLGEDSSLTALPASSLEFTVTNEISGEGSLALESKGANNIAEKQK